MKLFFALIVGRLRMGLDWMPGPKPRTGHEAEFDLWRKAVARRFCWGRTRKQVRLDEITVDPAETLGAPVVGQDEAADEWAREMFKQRRDKHLDMNAQIVCAGRSQGERFFLFTGVQIRSLVHPGKPRALPAYLASENEE